MNSNRKSFLVVIIIALIMTASLVGGYMAITKFSPAVKDKFDAYTDPVVESIRQANPEEAENESFDYRGTGRSDYFGPKIYEYEGYLINSEGKVVSDYRNNIGSSLRFTTDKDASQAVFTNMDMGYYVDADLNVTLFSKHTRLAQMSFDGKYFFYVDDLDYQNKLYLYDIENKTEELMAEGIFSSVCISPNGRTLVFTRYPNRNEIHVVGLDLEREKVFDARNSATPVSVSNDGETVFYYTTESDSVYYCLNSGKSTKLGKKNYRECYLDRDCKQFLYADQRGRIRYFRAGERKPITISGKDSRIYVNDGCAVSQDLYMDEYIINAASFSDAIMIVADKKCYALYGYTPKLVDMTEDEETSYFYNTYVSGDGAQCLYRSGEKIYKAVYDGESVSRSVLYESDHYSMEYACSPDLSRIWIRDGDAINFLKEGEQPVSIAEIDQEKRYVSVELAYDLMEDVCYFIYNNTLYCAGYDSESVTTVSDDCLRFGYSYREPKFVTVRDVNDSEFLIIKKEKLVK